METGPELSPEALPIVLDTPSLLKVNSPVPQRSAPLPRSRCVTDDVSHDFSDWMEMWRTKRSPIWSHASKAGALGWARGMIPGCRAQSC